MILFWHRQKEGETSRKLLETALLAYCGATGKRTPRKKARSVAEGAHGKPYYPALPSVFCSVSHSGGYWVALFDKHPCGVDIERATRARSNEAVIRRKFTPEEQRIAEGGEAAFLRVWTRKEAYLKYTGEGLTRDLLSFSVAETAPDGTARFREEAAPFYGEPRVVLAEIGFTAVTDADGEPLPLIGAVCATPGDLRILPLPERAPEDEREAAKEIALGFLETRARTEKEVRDKLCKKGVSAESADAAVVFLKEYGLVDDEAYAARFAGEAARKGKGPLRIERDLALKGIPREVAKRALAPYRNGTRSGGEPDADTPFPEEDLPSFRETAEAIARKTYEEAGRPDLDEKLAAKILRRLASRGFSAGDSYAALDALRSALREE